MCISWKIMCLIKSTGEIKHGGDSKWQIFATIYIIISITYSSLFVSRSITFHPTRLKHLYLTRYPSALYGPSIPAHFTREFTAMQQQF